MGDLAVAVPAVDLAPAPHRAGDRLLALLAGHPGNVLHPARIEAGLRRGRRLVLPRSLLPLPALRVVGERRLGRRRGQARGAGPAVARRLPRLVQLAARVVREPSRPLRRGGPRAAVGSRLWRGLGRVPAAPRALGHRHSGVEHLGRRAAGRGAKIVAGHGRRGCSPSSRGWLPANAAPRGVLEQVTDFLSSLEVARSLCSRCPLVRPLTAPPSLRTPPVSLSTTVTTADAVASPAKRR